MSRHYFELANGMYGTILSITKPRVSFEDSLNAENRLEIIKNPNTTHTINFKIYNFSSGVDNILSGGYINSFGGHVSTYGIRQRCDESLDLILVGLFDEEYKKNPKNDKKIILDRILDALIPFLETSELPSKLENYINTIVKIYEDLRYSLLMKAEFMQGDLEHNRA